MIRLLCLGGLSICVGGVGGWFLRGMTLDSGVTASSEPVSYNAPIQRQTASLAPDDIEQLRLVIREEVASSLMSNRSAGQAAAADKPPAKRAAPPSAELLAQRHEALEDIRGLMSVDQWGSAEQAEFHRSVALLDADQARQALQELSKNLSNGTIHLAAGSPDLPQ